MAVERKDVINSLAACAASAGLEIDAAPDGDAFRLAVRADGRPVLEISLEFRANLFDLTCIDMVGGAAAGRRHVRYREPSEVRSIVADVERAMRVTAVRVGILEYAQLPSNAYLKDFVRDLANVSVRGEERRRWDGSGPLAEALVDEARAALARPRGLTRSRAIRLLHRCTDELVDLAPETAGVGIYMMCLRAQAVERGSRIKPIPAWEWGKPSPDEFMRPRTADPRRLGMPRAFRPFARAKPDPDLAEPEAVGPRP